MSRRRRSSSGLTTVLVVLILFAALYALSPELRKALGGDGGEPGISVPTTTTATRPATTRPPARGTQDLKTNLAVAKQLGGVIDYGRVDPRTGQRSGIKATITRAMVEAADEDRIGSPANPSIRPAGYDALPARNRARGHLLGRQLGGSGDVAANLVALYQQRANSPVMRDFESDVAQAAAAGETIRYEVLPVYRSRTDTGAPYAIRLKALGDRGFKLAVEIANSPQAPVKQLAVT